MIERIDADKKEFVGCLTIGKDWFRDFTGKEIVVMDQQAEKKMVELGKLIRDFGLGKYRVQTKGA